MPKHHLIHAGLSLALSSLLACHANSTPSPSSTANAPTKATCPEGEVEKNTCVECGPTDGCTRSELKCFPTCETFEDCEDQAEHYDTCSAGVCTYYLCG